MGTETRACLTKYSSFALEEDMEHLEIPIQATVQSLGSRVVLCRAVESCLLDFACYFRQGPQCNLQNGIVH